jgi:hypothetical protein
MIMLIRTSFYRLVPPLKPEREAAAEFLFLPAIDLGDFNGELVGRKHFEGSVLSADSWKDILNLGRRMSPSRHL